MNSKRRLEETLAFLVLYFFDGDIRELKPDLILAFALSVLLAVPSL